MVEKLYRKCKWSVKQKGVHCGATKNYGEPCPYTKGDFKDCHIFKRIRKKNNVIFYSIMAALFIGIVIITVRFGSIF